MSDRIPVVALLAGTRHDYLHMARPLLKALEATHHFAIDVVTDGEVLPLRGAKVLLAASDHALQPGQALQLTDFVRAGGGVVLLHGTLAAWGESGDMSELARWTPSGPGPLTQLVVRPDPSHPLTSRLGSELKVHDELYFSEGPPTGASVLLRASWRFTEQVVAYERRFGKGTFVYVGLADDGSATFARLLGRSLLHAAG